MQDRLNGGISLLIHCPGSEATPTLLPEHLSVDVYITLHELDETPDRIGGDISVLVQAFSEEFTVPHLQHFTDRCRIEGVVPPHHCKFTPFLSQPGIDLLFHVFFQEPASQINPAVVPHLPAPMAATGPCICCSARPAQQFQHDLQANVKSNMVSSSAVQKGRSMALTNSNTLPNRIQQCWPANAFLAKGPMTPGLDMQEAPLISLGPHTDAILDRFKMDDAVLLRLHRLVRSVCSSCWEAVLRSPKWDLTYEQASNLARAIQLCSMKPCQSLLPFDIVQKQ